MGNASEIRDMRILLAGGKGHPVQVLRQVLGIVGIRHLRHIERGEVAVDLLCSEMFDAVFCDEEIECDGNMSFIRAARRTPGLVNSMMPIYLVSSGPRRRDVEAARDLGFTDVIGRPVSAATVLKKLKAALVSPRSFIAASDFFGPDRRSPARAHVRPNDRRKRQPKKVTVAAPSGPVT